MFTFLFRHNGRSNSSLIRQKHEMVRKCQMSDCYFPLCVYRMYTSIYFNGFIGDTLETFPFLQKIQVPLQKI